MKIETGQIRASFKVEGYAKLLEQFSKTYITVILTNV